MGNDTYQRENRGWVVRGRIDKRVGEVCKATKILDFLTTKCINRAQTGATINIF